MKNMWEFEECGKYLDIAISKVLKSAQRIDKSFPWYYYNDKGEYLTFTEGHWTDSFYPGMLYLSYVKTNDAFFMEKARNYNQSFEKKITVKKSEQDHDLGFLFTLKDVFDYKLTGDESSRLRALAASEMLLSRYNEKAGIIPAWDSHPFDKDIDYSGRIIADTMLNLPLLCWAYGQTNDDRYYNAAFSHGIKAQNSLVREDGSSFHVCDFNPKTGEMIQRKTMQGYSDDSCWARGQSWIIYGFALLYKNTGFEEFLNTALKAAEYFISHTPAYGVPLWDFGVSELQYKPWDSSAGAIAVCGMLEICRHLPDEWRRNYYYQNAVRIMNGLTELCSTLDTYNMEPLLMHGCGAPAYRKGSELLLPFGNPDTCTIFGDYYYLEALMRFNDENVTLPW